MAKDTIKCIVFPEDTIEVSHGPGGTMVQIVHRDGKRKELRTFAVVLSPRKVKRLRKMLKPGENRQELQ